ncbi:MAG TPA: hypothetical protein VE907_15670 [Gammaproteobacteria bacterium]|nr:hypothetical protein [Gammaproteobacteria bacterium]
MSRVLRRRVEQLEQRLAPSIRVHDLGLDVDAADAGAAYAALVRPAPIPPGLEHISDAKSYLALVSEGSS